MAGKRPKTWPNTPGRTYAREMEGKRGEGEGEEEEEEEGEFAGDGSDDALT